jgi:hypothetical protein
MRQSRGCIIPDLGHLHASSGIFRHGARRETTRADKRRLCEVSCRSACRHSSRRRQAQRRRMFRLSHRTSSESEETHPQVQPVPYGEATLRTKGLSRLPQEPSRAAEDLIQGERQGTVPHVPHRPDQATQGEQEQAYFTELFDVSQCAPQGPTMHAVPQTAFG